MNWVKLVPSSGAGASRYVNLGLAPTLAVGQVNGGTDWTVYVRDGNNETNAIDKSFATIQEANDYLDELVVSL
jgi:hypothetical protein